MRYVLGEPTPDEAHRLRRLVGMFVAARALKNEPMFGIEVDGVLAAAATTSFPGRGEAPAAFTELREDTWRELGPEARARYDTCGATWATMEVDVPHVHLNMIGVRGAHRGTGLSRHLLERVHRLSLETPGSEGVTLTTEHPGNVPYYEHMGYEVVGHAQVGPGLETWGFFRKND